ncbi:hypothetical protein [Marinigracilibium pacificum]|uniref:Uncharacterized protein n=1 Tax=Marinigracilibium pacificum TaxID=2729599 RepID=A0A848IWT1_9BACT|nr:hypothetical protein [Marinigracilibium pacificum]NMM47628.1 hypothetical protein [Marinigracilibium pacificum]
MRIVFGTYTFKIKSFTCKDLGIEEDTLNNFTMEVRQKIFHIFWIPLFSTNKIFALRQGNELFHAPSEIENLIRARNVIKTPWYSFSGLILILLVFLFYQVMELL